VKTKKQSPTTKSNAATTRDVAKHADVSLMTVSHAISGQGRVSQKTRDRILQTVEELGYVASPHAQSLKTVRSMTFLALLQARNLGEKVCTARLSVTYLSVPLITPLLKVIF
jgi:DNA-binding LacI/PurR family transcriptional regulator